MKQVWFGTADDMRWVPAPLAGAQGSEVRWRAVDQYLNGGASVRQSTAAHQEINLTWGVQSTERLAPVVSLLHQPGPFYYVDPIAAQSNIVPSYWASPQAWLDDGPALVPGVTPTKVAGSGPSVNGYPTTSVRFTIAQPTATNIIIPVPDGYTLHMGVRGTGGTYQLHEASGESLFHLMSYVNDTVAYSPSVMTSEPQLKIHHSEQVDFIPEDSPTDPNAGLVVVQNQPMAKMAEQGSLSPETATRTNMSFAGPGFATLELTSAGTYTISGIIGQILPNGTSPKAGGFLPGLGATALMLKDDPSITNYSAALPTAQRGIAANFVEVGAWLQ